MHKQHFLN